VGVEDYQSDFSNRYEHLGDTVLGLVVTDLLIDMYPCLRVGPSTVSRSSFILPILSCNIISSIENQSVDGW
jgi:dsRNA-specific ribonuclease